MKAISLCLGLLLSAVATAAPVRLGTLAGCQVYSGDNAGLRPEQVWVPGGRFVMGADDAYLEEAPAHAVAVTGFWIDRHEVTNAQFARFVAATGYRTVAERGLDPARHPAIPPAMTRPGSTVFVPPKTLALGTMQWWQFVPGADWRHPDGPGSSLRGRDNHPVVHIAREDARAYAKWAGRDLPTEAEFEYAARGGVMTVFPWGKMLAPGGKPRANTWQGAFPFQNDKTDGFVATAPVGCYAANRYGLYDMVGNVWEWVSDGWRPRHGDTGEAHPDIDLEDALQQSARTPALGVIKGGSFLCSPLYCKRYRPTARHAQDVTMGASHIGFRTVWRGAAPR